MDFHLAPLNHRILSGRQREHICNCNRNRWTLLPINLWHIYMVLLYMCTFVDDTEGVSSAELEELRNHLLTTICCDHVVLEVSCLVSLVK